MDLCQAVQPCKLFLKLRNIYNYDNINKSNFCGSIFIDISKAFDSVYHPRLLLKLEHLGLSNIYINWFKSFNLLRSQRVLFNRNTSSNLRVYAGVPHGSVLMIFLMWFKM